MSEATEPAEQDLCSRVIAAQRTYILALLACEKAIHAARCPHCGAAAGSRNDRLIRLSEAAAEKEACRICLRDLLDELGYVPEGLTLAIPETEDWCCRTRAYLQ